MSKQMSNSAKRRVTVYSVGFVFVFLLSLLFPYSGDDWAWGSQIGLDRLAAHFEAYNGRYVGNLIVLAMTRSNVLKALCMSLFIIAMLYMIEKIVGNRTAPLIASAALLLMPTDMLRQSIVWDLGLLKLCHFHSADARLCLLYRSHIRKNRAEIRSGCGNTAVRSRFLRRAYNGAHYDI